MAQGASQAAVARRQFELGMGHGLWHTRKRGGNRRGRAQDFLNRCEVDITASCGECRVKAIRREDQTMLSRRSFLKSTLGAGLALATQGCQQMVAQPRAEANNRGCVGPSVESGIGGLAMGARC